MRLALIFLMVILSLTMASGWEEYLWKKRVIVISAPSLTDAQYRAQAAELVAEWAGLIDRDFTVQARMGAKAFSVVLIGKDGQEKLRRTSPLAPNELFAIVDAMPMRQAEMRNKNR